MAKKEKRSVWERLKDNFVFRNIVLAISVFVLFILLVVLLLNVLTRHNKYKDVPDFVGITMDEAYRYAAKDKLQLEINDSLYVPTQDPGVILEQRPSAGAKVKSGRRVFLTLNSFQQKIVDVPHVAGYSLRHAKSVLETAGFEIEKLVYVDDIAKNNVIRQDVNGIQVTGDVIVRAKMGSGITLTVGLGRDSAPVIMPRLVGMPIREAKSRLWDSGLNYDKGVMADDINTRNQRMARIWKQEPEQNEYVPLGTGVTLWLSLDSLTIAHGIKTSDERSRTTTRYRSLNDSLSNAGYRGDLLEAEIDWKLRMERGEALPQDRPRTPEELLNEQINSAIQDAINGSPNSMPEESQYQSIEVPIELLDIPQPAQQTRQPQNSNNDILDNSTEEEDEFFF